MSAPRVAHCVFCDDVRNEVGNKLSLMGLYVGDIIFPSKPPVMYPKLGIAVWVITDVDDRVDALTLRIVGPDKAELWRGEVRKADQPPLREGARKAFFQVATTISPLLLTQEGWLEAHVDMAGETLRAGRLFVRFDPPPVKSTEPASGAGVAS